MSGGRRVLPDLGRDSGHSEVFSELPLSLKSCRDTTSTTSRLPSSKYFPIHHLFIIPPAGAIVSLSCDLLMVLESTIILGSDSLGLLKTLC
jgi:hypothetical protein